MSMDWTAKPNRTRKRITGTFITILAGTLFISSCLSKPTAPANTPLLPASQTVTPSRQPASSPTSSPTPVPSLTLLPTSTVTPQPPGAESGQQLPTLRPQTGITLEPGSIADASQLALWGRSAIRQRLLAANGQVWIIHSPLGIYLYNTQTLDLIALIDDVRADQISPDGQHLAVADSNDQISLYRLLDGQQLLSLDRPQFAANPDEPDATAPAEGTPGLEQAGNPPEALPPQLPDEVFALLDPEHQPGITALHFSADGIKLAAGYSQPAILVWDLHTGQVEHQLQHAIMPAAYRIEFSPDGKYLASNTFSNVLGLWSLAEDRLIWRTANGGRLTTASFLPDGRRMLTESTRAGRVYVWDIVSGSLDQTIQATNLGDYLNFSQDGQSLFFLTRRPQSGRNLIEQRSLRDGKLETFAEFVTNYAISPDRLSLAGMDENGQLLHFNLRSWELSSDPVSAVDPSATLLFAFSGKALAAVSEKDFDLWSFPDLQPLAEITSEQPLFNLHLSDLQGLQILPDDRLLAYGWDGGRLFIWDVFNSQIDRFEETLDAMNQPVLSPDGRYLAICTSGGLLLYDLNTFRASQMDSCKSPGLLVFSNDQTHLARASGLQIDLLNLPGGSRSRYLAGNTLEITSLVFSPDGSYFASGTSPERGGAESVVWDFARPLFPKRLPVPSNGVESLAFSGDHQYLATGGGDDKIRLWRVSDGWLLRVRALEGSASKLIFSPDDQMVAAGLSSGDIQLLSIPDGEPLAVLKGHAGRVTGLAFSQDGTALYSSSVDGTVRLWGISVYPGSP